MKFNIRTIFLKSLPYLMSIAGGVILYTGAIDNAPNDNLRDLIIDISGSLLSIPLVFLLYDYMNYRISNQMKKALINTTADKLNTLMLNIILMLRESMNVRSKLTPENLNRMLMWRVPDISRRLKITPRLLEHMHEYHNELDTILYRSGQNGALTTEHAQILAALTRDMTRVINENKFRRGKHAMAKYIENMMSHILDWLDLDTVAALHFQEHLNSDTGDTENMK